jgi:hypothetical protein
MFTGDRVATNDGEYWRRQERSCKKPSTLTQQQYPKGRVQTPVQQADLVFPRIHGGQGQPNQDGPQIGTRQSRSGLWYIFHEGD